MALSVSNFDPALKDFYEGSVRETLNNDIMLFRRLDETDKSWSGRRVTFPVHTARTPGVGARAENATLPSAGCQTYNQAVVSACYLYGRIQLSGPVIQAGKHAFAQALASEMEGMTRDLKNDLARQTWGTGDGRLAQIGNSGSGTAVTLLNRYFEPGQPGARYVFQGQILDFGTVAAPTVAGTSVRVQAVALSTSPGTTTDTLNVSGTYAGVTGSDNFIFNFGAGGSGIEMMGLRALVDVFSEDNPWNTTAYASATVQNISRQTVDQWNSLVLGNSGTERIIDGNLMQQAFDRINVESGMEPNLIAGQHDIVRAFLDSVAADRRYSSPTFDAGVSSLSYNGVAIEKDRHAPYNELFVGNTAGLKLYTLLDFTWADEDGAVLSRVSNTDAFEAFIKAYKNIGLENPRCLLFIRDIRVDL